MQSKTTTPEDYIREMPEERQAAFRKLRAVIKKNLPGGFREVMSYGHIGFVIPHGLYPDGYHCDPSLPLPFIAIASQKNFIAVYHMGLYANPVLLKWFTNEFSKGSKTKLDMGKSCMRFKKPGDIPFSLIGELCSKITTTEWIAAYEKSLKK
jgi:Domain of unknown function (DU1801)